ncbi:MAG: ribonuclease HIII [Bacilli bacterium]|nr:ribonuclease HIII [Bacilli bacterium]
MTIVFKVSDNVKKKVIEYYKDLRKDKTPPYAVFQAVEADTVITLYESGKLMFQGISADIDANIWVDLEKRLNNRIIDITSNDKKKDKDTKEKKEFFNESTIGSDEVGTGDFFGPIVVSASFVSKDQFPYLIDLGVKDSKKLDDEKIIKIAPELIKNIPHVTYILDNKTYNSNYSDDMNMNKIKSVLHNKVLIELIKKENPNYSKIVIDQFVYPKKYYEHINGVKEKLTNITFTTKAEDKCLSVAVASIISRYIFLKKMKELSNELDLDIPKGAGTIVDEVGAKIVKEHGYDKLYDIAKMNFKNKDKIKELL